MRDRTDPNEKPFLHMLLSISWVHWFVACVAGWILFAALYWVLPPGPQGNLTWGQGFQVGVGRGVWQGLYYWLQQQEVARGGQPGFYYALLREGDESAIRAVSMLVSELRHPGVRPS